VIFENPRSILPFNLKSITGEEIVRKLYDFQISSILDTTSVIVNYQS